MAEQWRPDLRSSDYQAMAPFWTMIDDILGGAPAIRKAGERYLPRFPSEDLEAYNRRLSVAPWTPLYAAAVRQLAAKPFEREVQITTEPLPPAYDQVREDVDGAGNHLNVFAGEVFYAGINAGVDWIFVDYPRMPDGSTLADEREAGARPMWWRVPAHRLLAVYEAFTGVGTEIVHARIDETTTEINEWGVEEVFHRVRVLNREQLENGLYDVPTWKLYEQSSKERDAWSPVSEGVLTIGVIPLVPFLTGRRIDGSWRLHPPMRDLAYMQITEYQAASNLAEIQTMTAFPMLKALGVEAPDGGWVRGPRVVLEAPMADGGSYGDYAYIEPSGTAAASLREDLERIRREMREEGMQPLLPTSGNVTATATAIAESKAHSAAQAWALRLKDALEQAFVYTAMWLDDASTEIEVNVFTDFAVDASNLDAMNIVREMQADGTISREACIAEAKRRNILMPEYDAEADLKTIAEEGEDEDEGDIRAALLPPLPLAGEPPQLSGMDEEE